MSQGANQVSPRLGHQVLNSYLQSANNQTQVDMPISQFVASTSAKTLPSFPLTSDLDMLLRNRIDKKNGLVSP